jgi:thiamine-phosphate pyrophosphorylase
MHAHQPLPRLWLMTDERQGNGLLSAVRKVPKGAGIVFRHYSLPQMERRALFDEVRAAHSGLLLLAGSAEQAKAWGADGSHGKGAGEGLRTAPAHNFDEIRDAEAAGAALVFLSPVYATRSHPDRWPLGEASFMELVGATRVPVVALGGVDAAKGERLMALGAYGWAGIDAWA